MSNEVEALCERLNKLTACRRCECISCADGYENHSHSCTHGPDCVETAPRWAAWRRKVSVVATASVTLIRSLSAKLAEAERENFALAADQCHAGYAGENGDHSCKEIDALRSENERLTQERDDWRKAAGETQEALQSIGEEFGAHGGELRVDAMRRLLIEARAENALLRGFLTSPTDEMLASVCELECTDLICQEASKCRRETRRMNRMRETWNHGARAALKGENS